jgi:hypothetical protein
LDDTFTAVNGSVASLGKEAFVRATDDLVEDLGKAKLFFVPF